jgi:GNAT superfamily N-acetyltransferase
MIVAVINNNMKDILIEDEELDSFVKSIETKYKNELKSIMIDHRIDEKGMDYLYFILLEIKKESKNKGLGRSIIQEVIDYANKHNFLIKIWVCPILGSDEKRLTKFYENLGFIKVEDEKYNMIYHY